MSPEGLRRFLTKHPTEPTGQITPEDIEHFMKTCYEYGGSPDIVYVIPEEAYRRGIITLWELRWWQLKRTVRRVGTWTRNAISGVRSALRTLGSRATR